AADPSPDPDRGHRSRPAVPPRGRGGQCRARRDATRRPAHVGDGSPAGTRRAQRRGLPHRRHAQGRPRLPPARARPADEARHDVHRGAVTPPAVLPGPRRAPLGPVRPEQRRAPQLRGVRRLGVLRPVLDDRHLGPGRGLRDGHPRQAPQPLRRRRTCGSGLDQLRHPAGAGHGLRELHVLRRRLLHRRLRHHTTRRTHRRRHRHLGGSPALPDLRQPRGPAHLVPGLGQGRRGRRPGRTAPAGRGGVRRSPVGPEATGLQGSCVQRGGHARQGACRQLSCPARAPPAEAAQHGTHQVAPLRRRGARPHRRRPRAHRRAGRDLHRLHLRQRLCPRRAPVHRQGPPLRGDPRRPARGPRTGHPG
ncbi:MAG: hypothetical protein AVDCRST_MAG60-2359, partial [uncultured Nocardioides sp.]